ncbi:PREDICTED: uncharacterized protein LOC109227690 [Nicotiana attenuata]|uniref:uncharacterized protein LOC109227690 n=1 Tax=Nicotiana attenuata TaxID=49451 RepID=UPI00090490FD|nr:PREDICTED: uncharacterized protein LOC109227690 [Nicotiana attenuata]
MENSNKGNSVMRIVSETPSSSVVQTNGTVHASPGKEQRANPMDNQKVNQQKSSIPTVDKGRSWAGLLQENKLVAKEENLKWTRAVILYVVGNTSSIGAIKRFITNQWANVQKPKVLFHNDGYFIILLSTNEEKERVMMNGPYTINSRPVMMRQWSESFDFNEEVLRTIPLWIKFPNLPLNLWSNQALSKIGSGLGKPLYVDACTTIAERIIYAGVLIEMDVTRPLPEKIKLYDPKGKVLEQLVHYDWKPMYCQKCCQLGHICKDQRKQKQDGMIQKTGEGMQKQEWRKQSNPKVEPQWQVARGKSATKKHADVIREKEVDIGNAFKTLVDTAQKIVQLSEAQDEKEKQNKKARESFPQLSIIS